MVPTLAYTDTLARLTPRQQEILLWIAHGASNPEIAAALCISPNTLQHHISAIYARLGCTNRMQLLLVALRANVIDLLPDTRSLSA
jgi:DNA-binding NarL/FixJ family response regulator